VLLSGATVAAGEGRVGGYSGHGCDCKRRRCPAWGGGRCQSGVGRRAMSGGRAWGGQSLTLGGGGDNASGSAIPRISHKLEPRGGRRGEEQRRCLAWGGGRCPAMGRRRSLQGGGAEYSK
jgi:hypothetical protein